MITNKHVSWNVTVMLLSLSMAFFCGISEAAHGTQCGSSRTARRPKSQVMCVVVAG
jgi:hypothetical protein